MNNPLRLRLLATLEDLFHHPQVQALPYDALKMLTEVKYDIHTAYSDPGHVDQLGYIIVNMISSERIIQEYARLFPNDPPLTVDEAAQWVVEANWDTWEDWERAFLGSLETFREKRNRRDDADYEAGLDILQGV